MFCYSNTPGCEIIFADHRKTFNCSNSIDIYKSHTFILKKTR